MFPLDSAHESAQLHRKTWATSYDSLPSSTALDDGLDPQPNHHLDRCLTNANASAPPLSDLSLSENLLEFPYLCPVAMSCCSSPVLLIPGSSDLPEHGTAVLDFVQCAWHSISTGSMLTHCLIKA